MRQSTQIDKHTHTHTFLLQRTYLLDDISHHVSLVEIDRTEGERFDEVEEVYLKAIEVSEPEELESAYGMLAGFYYRTDRFDVAVSTLRQGIEELDEGLDLIYLLARFYNMNGEKEKADALIEEATRAAPDSERPYMILSTYRSRQNDLEGALEAVERVLEINPENTEGQLRNA